MYRARAFKEKPNLKLARSFVTSGKYLWNSGMFVWKVSTIMEAFRKHMPALYDGVSHLKKAFSKKAHEKEVKRFYDKAESISIDYGVMERAENVAVVRADFKWDDVGSWTALERLREKDKTGSVTVGDFVGIDTRDCIVYSRSGLVGTIGIDNLIIIRTEDATLICKKERAQDVRALVSLLSERKLEEYL